MSTDYVSAYIIPAAIALLTALAGWLGQKLRQAVDKYLADKTKRAVARTCVKAVEQLYHELGGEEKRVRAEKAIVEMLAEKGVTITELEMRMNIEAVVAEFNYGFGGKKETPAAALPIGGGTEEPDAPAGEYAEDGGAL